MTTQRKDKHSSIESLPQRMERLTTGGLQRNVRMAQDLVYDSWEAADSDKEFELLTKAVDIDPRNVDAWLGLMQFQPLDAQEEIAFLRRLVAMGEKNLGKKTFREAKGIFWGLLETRPYMRARAKLAFRLMESGRLEESATEHEGMLELNPNDNQGVRYGLMALYLAMDKLEGANHLFGQYNERNLCATFAWAYVMERFLAGDTAGAVKALAAARKQNPHAEAYFAGIKKLPKKMPDRYSMGSPEEATIAWEILKPAWEKHPEAHAWMISQCAK